MPGSVGRPLVASYRFQLTPSFGFADVAGLVPALRTLGISHLYLSPIAEAVTGSEHGYDVVDHRLVRAEFGGPDGLRRLMDTAVDHDLGVIVDHVPNHVSVARAELNPHWWAMLRDGPGSDAADWFDVDWELTGGRVIVPKLGEPLDEVLAAGAIETGLGDLGPELRIGDLLFPLAQGTEDLPVADAVAAQHYRLQWWRDPARNVRRFFTIDDLVAVRVEHDRVVRIVDTLPRVLCDHPAFDGVRVDHVDGLADPRRYLEGLRDLIGDRWLLVEKILGPDELLPGTWPVDGTTGYEHVTITEHALLDPTGQAPLDRLWVDLTGSEGGLGEADFRSIEHTARAEVLDEGLRPDVDRLVRLVTAACDLDAADVRGAVVALTLELDRYRTYLPDDETSEAVLADAAAAARTNEPDGSAAIDALVRLVRESPEVGTRWQQLTGPAMAKGAEDRAFYRHRRLAALCEVGGSPGTWTLGVDAFHDHQERIQAGWPVTMLTATTHDTKRSEGVRARSLALVTLADDWTTTVRSWFAEHPDLVTGVQPGGVSLALQTAVTAWPLTVDRLHDYLVKAAREAELRTDWSDPADDYEARLLALATGVVDETGRAGTALAATAERLADAGVAIGLRVLALQLTCPGVPDLYQGAPGELLGLVDPDNRRLPDWDRWRALVDGAAADADPDDVDAARARLVDRVLRARRAHPRAFGREARYRRLTATGPDGDRVLAFARTDGAGDPALVTVVVRPGAGTVDADVGLPDGTWRDLVSDATIDGGDVDVATITGATGVAVFEPAA